MYKSFEYQKIILARFEKKKKLVLGKSHDIQGTGRKVSFTMIQECVK